MIALRSKPLQEATQLTPAHLNELRASAISDTIIFANFNSVAGNDVLEWLTKHKIAQLGGHASQYATGPVRNLYTRMQPVTDAGGWQGCGLDPLNHWQRMDWGCFKPNAPREGWKKDKNGNWTLTDKPVKYEHPQGTTSHAFFPDLDATQPHLGRNYWRSVVATTNTPIVITEGIKKACSLMSHGYASIGLPGVAMWNKPKTRELIAELDLFAVEGRTFYICFDQDNKLTTRQNVRREIFKLSAALRRRRCKVHVIEWSPALGKGVDDLIVNQGPKAFADAYRTAVSYEVFSVRAQSELGFPANWTCPEHEKYLTNGGLLEALPKTAKLMGLKAPKGTGKTEAAKAIAHLAMEQGQRVLLLSHRIQLTNALAQRVCVLSVYEMNTGDKHDREIARAEVAANGMALCVHSCHPESQARFDASEWSDALIIIDEASQVWREVLNSSTISKQRVPILRELRTLLTNVLSPESEGRVLLMDADLDKLTISAICGIANRPGLTPWIGVSNYRGETYTCYTHQKPEQWLIDAEERLATGKRLLVMTDSQKKKGRFSSVALEERWKKNYPQLRILRVDSETLNLKQHPAFGCIDKVNDVFGQYDVVICSPSVETGVSLDLRGHFDCVYGCYQGVLSENSVRQSLARLREPVDRVVYIAPRGLEIIGGGETWWKSLQESQNEKVKSTLKKIFDAARDDLRSDFLPSQVEAWAKYAARHNAGLACYRDVVIDRLRDEGQVVIELQPNNDDEDHVKGIRQETRWDRHERLVAHGIAVCSADKITDLEYEQLQEARSIESQQKSREFERKSLAKRYGVEPTLELFMLHEYDWFSKIRLHYYLTAGRQHLQVRDIAKINELLEKVGNQKDLWTPDVARSSLSLKIACLEWLEIPKVLALADIENPSNLETEYLSNHHPVAISIADKAKANAQAIKVALGVTIGKNSSPCIIVRNLIEKLGFGFGKATRSGPKGAQQRYYPVQQIDSKVFTFSDEVSFTYTYSRNEIFTAWLERDSMLKTNATLEASAPETTVDVAIVTEPVVVSAGNKDLSSSPQSDYLAPTKHELVTVAAAAENPVTVPDAAEPVAVPQPVLYPVPDYVTLTPGLDWESQQFEGELINARTMEELAAAKQHTPEPVRRRVMERWQLGKRFDWLREKAERLMSGGLAREVEA